MADNSVSQQRDVHTGILKAYLNISDKKEDIDGFPDMF